MKTVFTAVALAALLTSTALAQTPAPPAPAEGAAPAMPAEPAAVTYSESTDAQIASYVLGAPVLRAPSSDAESIGDINDLVFDANGQITHVVIGVGGFLGMGEKNVALPFEELYWAAIPETEDYAFVLETTKEALEGLPEFKWEEMRGEMTMPAADSTMAPTGGTMEPEPQTAPATPGGGTMPETPAEGTNGSTMPETPVPGN